MDKTVSPQMNRKIWTEPKLIRATLADETRGGFANPAAPGEIHFPSLGTTSNHPSS